ncbi:MAG TPA: hypothetical protein VN771_01430 [Candidatus Baltobacteraceae bacterium]|nr:hypothetical protein [Candidatus Baltobacteraceae bacterium]
MDAAAWIRSRLAGFTCAACGRHYRRDHIRVLAQREALFFVALDCRACAAESVAIVSLEHGADGSPTSLGLGDPDDLQPALSDGDPDVLASDVLAMHEFLRGFDGDFRGLFGTPRERPERPGTAGA